MPSYRGQCPNCKTVYDMDKQPENLDCTQCGTPVDNWEYDPRTPDEKLKNLLEKSGICDTCGSITMGQKGIVGTKCYCGGNLLQTTEKDFGLS